MPARLLHILFVTAVLLCDSHTASAGNNLEADVAFLSDSLCCGRASGTGGAVEAAWYIRRRMEQLSLNPVIQTFRVAGKEGGEGVICRNVVSEIRRPGTDRWLVVTAYYDGLGIKGGVMYPGADGNASGVAALLALADSLVRRKELLAENILIAALDAHYADSEGAGELWRRSLSGKKVKMAVNFDIIGSSLAPVKPYFTEYVIVLGGKPYRKTLDGLAREEGLNAYYDYYGSRDFTDLFYRKMGDQKVFLGHDIPSVMVTSGITSHTNKTSDTAGTLDYDQLERRVSLILSWLEKL